MFVTLPIVAYPDNPAAHIVRNQWFGSVTVREDHQAVILMFVGIVDGLLERGSAASDDCDSGTLVLDESLFRVQVV